MKLIRILGIVMTTMLLNVQVQAQDLRIWGLQAFNTKADALIGEMVKQFGRERGIAAEYVVVPANVLDERLAAAFEGRAAPDVFMQVGQKAQYYSARDLTVPLDDVLAEMRKVPGGIFENLVPQGTYNGAAHAVPLEVDVVPMFARVDLLQEVGLKEPQTWEELRQAARAIQSKNPMVSGFGLPVSTANDAESLIRMIIWSFGGAEFAPDGKTITFNSPETRAAYQFIADMFLKDRTIPRAALTWDDAGNNTAYQTGRTAFTINPPSIYAWLQANDPKLLAGTRMIAIPRGPGEKGRNGSSVSSFVWSVSKQSTKQDHAKAWLRYFFEPARYQQVIEAVGGRWLPIYKAQLDIPLFKNNPDFANVGQMAETGIVTGFQGPPTALAGRAFEAKIVTSVAQRILVDGKSVDESVAWGQEQYEALAKQK
jgi:multiple sugar transport system substrate-binding protein